MSSNRSSDTTPYAARYWSTQCSPTALGYSFARTAEIMRAHPNTIRYRPDKVRELSGLDHRVAQDLVVLTLCASAARRTDLEHPGTNRLTAVAIGLPGYPQRGSGVR